MTLANDVTAAAATVRSVLGNHIPQVAVVLGSGFSSLPDLLIDANHVNYAELPGFVAAAVVGHQGRLWHGTLSATPLLLFEGRYHLYEGYSPFEVTALVRLAHALGCRRVLLTNAVGGIADSMSSGDFMLVNDHLNLVGESPLRGQTPPQFIDLTRLYAHDFYPQAHQRLASKQIELHRGVLAWMSGPNYETPAEIRMLAALGADAVSMSTVPEAIMAHALGLDVAALSLISNAAAGKSAAPLLHEDVLAEGRSAAEKIPAVIDTILDCWT